MHDGDACIFKLETIGQQVIFKDYMGHQNTEHHAMAHYGYMGFWSFEKLLKII